MATDTKTTDQQLQDIDSERMNVLEKQQEAVDETIQKRDTELGKANTEIDRLYQQQMNVHEPEPFDYRKIKPPHHELSRDFMIKGAILLGVSLIGATYMRVGATGAMAGLSSALQALQAGDKLRYDEEMKRYETTIKLMGQEYERRQKHYNNIIKDINRSIQQKEHSIRLLHLQFGEDYKEAIRPYNEQLKWLDAQAKMMQRLKSTVVIRTMTHDSRTSPQKEYDRIARENGPKWKKEHPYDQWFSTDWPKIQQEIRKKSGSGDSPFKKKTYGPIFAAALEEAKKKNQGKGITESDIVKALQEKGFDTAK